MNETHTHAKRGSLFSLSLSLSLPSLSLSLLSTLVLTIAFGQVFQGDDVVFGRVQVDFLLGFERHCLWFFVLGLCLGRCCLARTDNAAGCDLDVDDDGKWGKDVAIANLSLRQELSEVQVT